ncbi:hypothetical protein LR48_Vigan08g092700 [Vigna angularis]|uniref:Glucosidase II beta subunit N-terminal domain-containing protein n=1 Tax=Phaseolus angularis TaxID=3914 RepID=A0A0L9V4U6_PHAAN|nr:hypothetical protein LR48_Vigan08g092700 [Vigna angularis]
MPPPRRLHLNAPPRRRRRTRNQTRREDEHKAKPKKTNTKPSRRRLWCRVGFGGNFYEDGKKVLGFESIPQIRIDVPKMNDRRHMGGDMDEKYYSSEVIKCKDGSKSFTRDRLNDNFCDCPDGTDEPGTSACPSAKFYCRNLGSKPQFIVSSHVNDHFCDCCDGSDEHDGIICCPNTCVMGGNAESKISFCKSNKKVKSDESVHNVTVGVYSTNGSGYLSGISLEFPMPHQIKKETSPLN